MRLDCSNHGSIRVWVALAVLATTPAVAFSDVILSLQNFGQTSVDTGVAGVGKRIDFLISQDGGEALAGVSPAFELQAGTVTSGIVSDAGSVGTPGYFGAGELVSSLFTISQPNRFEVSLEASDLFTGITPAAAPAAERFFTIELDTSGLAAGTYAIDLRPSQFNFATVTGGSLIGVASNESFSFQVTNVPEPSCLAMVTIIGICGFRRYVRRATLTPI